MPERIPKGPGGVKIHQARLEKYARTVVSGTLVSVVDGPGYTDVTVTGNTVIDFQRPLRDSFGKPRQPGTYWSQLTMVKQFSADVPGASGIAAVSAGIGNATLSQVQRAGNRYDVAADQHSVLVVTIGGSGFTNVSSPGRTWFESIHHLMLAPDDTVTPQAVARARTDDGVTNARGQFTTAGTALLSEPHQMVRVTCPNTGTMRIYVGFAAVQVKVLEAPRTTFRPIRAQDLTLTAGTGTIVNNADGTLEVTAISAGEWTFPIPGLGTLDIDEVILFGVVMDLPPGNFTIGLTDGTNTPYDVGLRATGGVLSNGGSTLTYATHAGVWDGMVTGFSAPGIFYGWALDVDGVVLHTRGDNSGAGIMTAGDLIGTFMPTVTGTHRAGYWCTGPIPLEIVPRVV